MRNPNYSLIFCALDVNVVDGFVMRIDNLVEGGSELDRSWVPAMHELWPIVGL